ncbi:MAG TPA: hypothetical protein VGJ83_00940 [Gemmatimonadales bacterium]|jgi:hypothetical protein
MRPNLFRFARNASYVLGAAVLLLQLWDWFSTRRQGDLDAVVTFGQFRLPPMLERDFAAIRSLASPVVLDSIPWSTLYSKRARATVTADVSSFLAGRLPADVPPDVRQLVGYWAATVRNDGPRSLTSVTLTLPGARAVQVSRRGAPFLQHDVVHDVIPIGDLQPKEEVEVFAWTSVPIASRGETDITLTHDNGLGSVLVKRPVGRVGQVADRYWFLLRFLILLGFVWIALAVVVHLLRARGDRAAEELA